MDLPRDELEAHLYGRLGYDPSTLESTLRTILAQRVGTDGLWAPEQAGTDIVAWMVSAFTCGPDSRDFAPQLQWMGDVGYWAGADGGSSDVVGGNDCALFPTPIDRFSIASPYDTAAELVEGASFASDPSLRHRVSARDVAQLVLADADAARTAASVAMDPTNRWARDVQRECVALADLGAYFGHKLGAAAALAVFERTGQTDYRDVARTETDEADGAWRQLVLDTAYVKSFQDPLSALFRPLAARPADVPLVRGEPSPRAGSCRNRRRTRHGVPRHTRTAARASPSPSRPHRPGSPQRVTSVPGSQAWTPSLLTRALPPGP